MSRANIGATGITHMKIFNDNAATPAGRALLGAEFTDRLSKTQIVITTLNQLKQFTPSHPRTRIMEAGT